mmetsp:Transcript_43153/g.127872  ORF Transcript_43153/g.127872 Transcript_43153/m.127872 type:complete len:378 (+) Transcript_43153:63-1196(+)
MAAHGAHRATPRDKGVSRYSPPAPFNCGVCEASAHEEANARFGVPSHAMKDSLLQLGTSRTKAANQAKVLNDALISQVGDPFKIAWHAVLVAIATTFVYAVVVSLIFTYYHASPLWLIFCISLACFCATYALMQRPDRWQHLMGGFITGATVAGILIGLYLYYSFLIYYQHYDGMRVETNVAASQPAALFGDVGMLQFTSATRLDVGRSLGYRAAYLAETLCVAPVVDSSMGPTDGVTFFAIGLGCCEWRSSFDCDDAASADAAFGLLALDTASLVSPLMSWAVEDPLLIEGFHAAVKMSRAAFGTPLANQIRFLRWTKDPQKLRRAYLKRANEEFAKYLWIILLLSFVSAVCAITAFQRASLPQKGPAGGAARKSP